MGKSEALLEEENIIRKRFLTQTAVATSSGGGPPFRKLVLSYQAFCNSVLDSQDDAESMADAVLADIYSIQAYIHKLEAMMGAYLREQTVYQETHKDLLGSIDKAVEDIRACKSELEQARLEMAQAQDCERVKEQIVTLPACSVTLKEIDAVKSEIEELLQQQAHLSSANEQRKAQFKSILDVVYNVEQQIRESSMEAEDIEDGEDVVIDDELDD